MTILSKVEWIEKEDLPLRPIWSLRAFAKMSDVGISDDDDRMHILEDRHRNRFRKQSITLARYILINGLRGIEDYDARKD